MPNPFGWHIDPDTGLPVHLPMGVNAEGRGPVPDAEAHRYVCWCADADCLLTRVLALAWDAGARVGKTT